MEEGPNNVNMAQTPPPAQGQPYPNYGRPAYDVHYHYYYEPPKVKPGKSSKPAIAGGLLIVHGIVSILLAAMLILLIGTMAEGGEFFGMNDTADITGTVVYENGTPAGDVTITIMGEDMTTQTGSNGGYYIYDAPAGNQRIQVEKDGYNTIIHKTFLNPSDPNNPEDQGNDHDFTLRPGNETVEQGSYLPWAFIETISYVCASIIIITSIVSIIGGIYALQRKHYGFAVVGAVAGIISLGLLAGIALFILIIAKDEFKKQDAPPPPSTPSGGPQTSEGPP
jgi:hypothetical protein